MENDKITKRVYVGEYAGSHNTVKDCLRKRGLDVRQARRMVHDRSVLRGFVKINCKVRKDFDEMIQLGVYTKLCEALERWKSACG